MNCVRSNAAGAVTFAVRCDSSALRVSTIYKRRQLFTMFWLFTCPIDFSCTPSSKDFARPLFQTGSSYHYHHQIDLTTPRSSKSFRTFAPALPLTAPSKRPQAQRSSQSSVLVFFLSLLTVPTFPPPRRATTSLRSGCRAQKQPKRCLNRIIFTNATVRRLPDDPPSLSVPKNQYFRHAVHNT